MALATSPLVRRESLTDQTVRGIRDAILDGTYTLGQKLRESELLARFGVSSSVIREALHVLQGEGVIITRPYCGRSVFDIRPEECAELVIMRASFESYAAYLAAAKITPVNGDRILAAASRFVSNPPSAYGEWVDREIGFHRAVWEASQNQWLMRQLDQFTLPLFTVRMLDKGPQDSRLGKLWENHQVREAPDNPDGHQLLARTIAAGDADGARRIMLRHIVGEADPAQREILNL